jgi:hypothetical protein
MGSSAIQGMDKPTLVNAVEMKIREPEFPEEVREKLTADMIYLLDLLINQEDNSMSLGKLREGFLKIGTKSEFQEVYNDLFSLGIIFQTGAKLTAGEVYIPQEISLWLEDVVSEELTAMEE